MSLQAGTRDDLIDTLKAMRAAGELKILRGTFDAEIIDVEFIEKSTGQPWRFSAVSGHGPGRLSRA